MKTLLIILCLGFIYPLSAQELKGPPVPQADIKIDKVAPASATEIWIGDPYSNANFIRFSKETTQTRHAESEVFYTSDDAKYSGWRIVHVPNNPSQDQWRINTPQNLRAPNGGPVNYCVTVAVSCDGHNYSATCYSTCNANECGKSFVDFKGCKRWSWSF